MLMGLNLAIAQIANTVSVVSDPDFSSVVLLTHLDATTPLDQSDDAHTLTVGGAASRDTDEKQFGPSSFLFVNNQGSFISALDDDDWSLGQEFTIEAWINFFTDPPTETHVIISHYKGSGDGNQSWGWRHHSGTQLNLFWSTNGTNFFQQNFAWSPSGDVWYHVAVSRDSSDDVRMFVDGAQVGSTQNITATFFAATTLLRIGQIGDLGGDQEFVGHIDDVRITKGVARYTANFTAPSAPFPDS